MPSSYPGGFDSFIPPAPDDPRNNPSLAGAVTQLQQTVAALESVLGLSPQSTSATVAARLAVLQANSVPTGVIIPFGAATAPAGWFLCDGSAVSRTTYSALYSVIGSSFGNGNGSSTFNLPDFRGRMPLGAGTGAGDGSTGTGTVPTGTALTARTLGQWFGVQTHTIGTANLPVHTHTLSAHTHGVTIATTTGLATLAPNDNTTDGVSTANTTGTSEDTSGGPSDNTTNNGGVAHTHGMKSHWHSVGNTGATTPYYVTNHDHRAWFVIDAASGSAKARVSASGFTLSNYLIIESVTVDHTHTNPNTGGPSDNTSDGASATDHTHGMKDHTHNHDHTHPQAHTHTMKSHTHGFNHGHTAVSDAPNTDVTGNGGFTNTAIPNFAPSLVVNFIIKS
jgi:microcystin-dependent protein